MWFDRIKRFYSNKSWTKEMVRLAVECGKITKEEYEEITGEDYGE